MSAGFAGMIGAVGLWAIWGVGTPPELEDPKGNPDHWTHEECRRWLRKRELYPDIASTTEELRLRVKANMRIDRPETVEA
ncbi:hypothetical protein AAP_01344 [Ascosphaera apis ARSEF 7405]|uniref:Uncharacterized protein n=1 Tax=Ascosphaera apis ARSEF 7405 TaxID=392613 RepID=A0A168BS38_9EURO|nr:hypothetical protein AAP_01344 [Ascosphaera apis ARSEF 7405]